MSLLRTFYLLTVTQMLSMVGSQMTAIGVGIWLFSKTGNTTPLLLTVFFAEFPGMLAGSLAGVWVDRWDRRRVLLLADAGQAVASLVLLVSFLSGRFQVWHLYLVSLLQGIFATFQAPAEGAVVTLLVPEALRERANGLREMAFPLAGVLAPMLAGVLYAWIGVTGIIAVDLVTFAVAACVVFLVRIPPPAQSVEGQHGRGHPLKELRGGLRFLWRRPSLLAFLAYLTVLNFLLNGPLELNIPYLVSLTGSEKVMGTIMGVMSLGAFCGGLIIALWGGLRPRMPLALLSILVNGLLFLFYATLRTPIGLGLAAFILMIPLSFSWALFNSILQVKVPPDLQGRVFGVYAQLSLLGSTTSFLLTGPLVDRVLEPAVHLDAWKPLAPWFGQADGSGIGLLLFITGGLILLLTLAALAVPAILHLERRLPDYPVEVEKQ